ncbi:MFS transporter [Homoserinibacter sp. YIM 151385]|uniref:MFS transporter n=1 Tax=Homoserinibacter sp. YIM 151385 TaxID=2985506 RepID=UPI0022F05B54|nr:MFS transporter [Homoserinibacter sp. YIM 151385]WBU37974.1 MFS transporter [Homoserinibacter sp. YIM 151385]
MSAIGYLGFATPLRMASAGSIVAIPILAVQQLDDVALGGLLAGMSLAPAVLVAPLAGAWLDRARSPRTIMLASAAAMAAGYAVGAFLGIVPVPLVALALLLAGISAPFVMGGLSSFVTEEIPDERRAYADDALSYNIASVVGPAIVSLAISLGSARAALLLMAAVSALGALGLLGVRLRAREAEVPHLGRSIAAGARYLATHRPIALVTASGTLSQVGGGAAPIAAVALSLERAGTPDQGAWIVTAFAIGGLLGALGSAVRRWTSRSPVWVMGAGFAATGALLALAAWDLGMPWTIGVSGAAGIFTAASTAAMLRLRKQQSPLALRSQVFTVGSGLRATAAAVGAAIAGVGAGLPAGLLIGAVGVVWIASGALLLAYPRDAAPVED